MCAFGSGGVVVLGVFDCYPFFFTGFYLDFFLPVSLIVICVLYVCAFYYGGGFGWGRGGGGGVYFIFRC